MISIFFVLLGASGLHFGGTDELSHVKRYPSDGVSEETVFPLKLEVGGKGLHFGGVDELSHVKRYPSYGVSDETKFPFKLDELNFVSDHEAPRDPIDKIYFHQ